MPQPQFARPVIAREDITLAANDDAVKGMQASETFKVTPNNDTALTEQGHELGFAKYQFDSGLPDRLQARGMTEMSINAPLNRANEALKNGAPREELLQKVQEAAEAINKMADARGNKWLEMPKVEVSGDPAADLQRFNNISADVSAKAQQALVEFVDADKLKGSAEALWGPASMQEGVEKPKDYALQARQVASYEVDKMLGLGVTAVEKFGVGAGDKVVGVSVQADGAAVSNILLGKEAYVQADLSDPVIQRGFSDLEVMDYITGQIDRHPGNMFLDPSTGQVTGIDNDLAFPEISRKDLINGGGQFIQKMTEGMPSVVHADTAKKILAAKPEDLRKMLEDMPVPDTTSRLGQPAIDGAVKRLKDLQSALKGPRPDIKVVAQFDQKTYQAAIAKEAASIGVKDIREPKPVGVKLDDAKPKTSYLAAAEIGVRDAKEIQGAKVINQTSLAKRNEQGLNDLRQQTEQKLGELNTTKERRERHLAAVEKGGVKGLVNRARFGSTSELKAKIAGTQNEIDKAQVKIDKIDGALAKLQLAQNQGLNQNQAQGQGQGQANANQHPVNVRDSLNMPAAQVGAGVGGPQVDANAQAAGNGNNSVRAGLAQGDGLREGPRQGQQNKRSAARAAAPRAG